MPKGWEKIHDSLLGYGLRRSDKGDIYSRDVFYYFERDLFSVPENELDELYDKLQPILEEERVKRVQDFHARASGWKSKNYPTS